MHPSKVKRASVRTLTDLPNVGPATAADLRLLGFQRPQQLVGQDPFKLYERLCQRTKQRHDPCVVDVFMSITAFLNGAPPRPWWDFTAKRKRALKRPQPA